MTDLEERQRQADQRQAEIEQLQQQMFSQGQSMLAAVRERIAQQSQSSTGETND